MFPLSSDESGRQRWNIWKQTLVQLDPFTRVLFLYQLKLYFDRMMERHVKSFQGYELARMISLKEELDEFIIIEMECKKCNIYLAAFVDILSYLDAIYLKSEMKFYKSKSRKLVESKPYCEKCNTKLEFEKLII